MTNLPCSYCGKPHDHIGSGVICDGEPIEYKLPFKVVFQDVVRPWKVSLWPKITTTVFYEEDNLLYPDTNKSISET